MDRNRTSTGRWLVTGLLVATAVVHVGLIVRGASLVPLNGVIAVAALGAAVFVALRQEDAAPLLVAAVVGAVGVATYLLPGLLAAIHGEPYPSWLDPWSFASLLVDALVVRLAVFTLRRSSPTP